MKIAKWALLGFFFCSALVAQTFDEGQGVFVNDEGAIVLAADASVAIRKLNSPYIMLVLYMGIKYDKTVTVNRDDVIMVYKGQEYKMPALKEFRKNYKKGFSDEDLYRRMGKETLALSQMRFWSYQRTGFFPLAGETVVDSGTMANNMGFKTRVYFKNPGIKDGDEIIIKVKDNKNPEISGAVTVVLK